MAHLHPDERQLEEDARRVRELLLDIQTAAYSHAQTYTTVVIFGGYAALFAVWGFTKDHLSAPTVYWVGLLMGISVLTYVLFEIYAMLIRSRSFLRVSRLIIQELPPSELLARRAEIAAKEKTEIQRWIIPVWIGSLIITIATGVGAAAILLLSFAELLANPPDKTAANLLAPFV